MTGVKGQSGREPKLWVNVYRNPKGAFVQVTVPRSLLLEAGVDPDVPLVASRRALEPTKKSAGKSVVIQFRPAADVPERERQ